MFSNCLILGSFNTKVAINVFLEPLIDNLSNCLILGSFNTKVAINVFLEPLIDDLKK